MKQSKDQGVREKEDVVPDSKISQEFLFCSVVCFLRLSFSDIVCGRFYAMVFKGLHLVLTDGVADEAAY